MATHKYIPRIEQFEKNLFVEEYYSSTDTKIYMDDIEQSEIAYINYSLQEQLKPIYGYASRTFDDVAIGNRIVTGVFKVAIKNPEAQTSLADIKKQQNKTSQTDDYNESQQGLKDAIEWITEQKIPSEKAFSEDDKTFEYKSKLIGLGYDLDYNSGEHILKQVIKDFQKDKGLEVNGKLTYMTKREIDKAIKSNTALSMHIPKGTQMFTKPSFGGIPVKTVIDLEVFIIDKYDDGWMYVMTKDGVERFINTEGVK